MIDGGNIEVLKRKVLKCFVVSSCLFFGKTKNISPFYSSFISMVAVQCDAWPGLVDWRGRNTVREIVHLWSECRPGHQYWILIRGESRIAAQPGHRTASHSVGSCRGDIEFAVVNICLPTPRR